MHSARVCTAAALRTEEIYHATTAAIAAASAYACIYIYHRKLCSRLIPRAPADHPGRTLDLSAKIMSQRKQTIIENAMKITTAGPFLLVSPLLSCVCMPLVFRALESCTGTVVVCVSNRNHLCNESSARQLQGACLALGFLVYNRRRRLGPFFYRFFRKKKNLCTADVEQRKSKAGIRRSAW